MNGSVPPWPVAIVTGMLGSGKTTMISRMLHHAALADTLVLVNEFGEIGLDHTLLRAVTDNVILLPNGCVCCTIRNDIVQTLREMRRGWLAGTVPDFGRVLIETTGLAEPAPLIASIVSHPLVAEAFALQTLSTVVDGQYGLRQSVDNPTCLNQIGAADNLIISKGDLVDAATTAALVRGLQALNRLATIGSADDLDPEWLYRRTVPRFATSGLRCEEGPAHTLRVSTVLLRPTSSLAWTTFRVWLSDILDVCGSRLLRLKGRLTFDETSSSVIIQAVHHTFYPVVAAPGDPDGRADDFLVFIFDGAVPTDFERAVDAQGLGLEVSGRPVTSD